MSTIVAIHGQVAYYPITGEGGGWSFYYAGPADHVAGYVGYQQE